MSFFFFFYLPLLARRSNRSRAQEGSAAARQARVQVNHALRRRAPLGPGTFWRLAAPPRSGISGRLRRVQHPTTARVHGL